MKLRKTAIALGAALLLTMTGCGAKPLVNVEQAGMLTTAVISDNTISLPRSLGFPAIYKLPPFRSPKQNASETPSDSISVQHSERRVFLFMLLRSD